MTIPEMWIREGADLERDILPTVRSVGARQHGEKIRDWKYFNQAVSNAKARRERGLPPPDLVGAQHGGPHRPSAKVAAAQLLRDQMFNRRSA